MADTSEKEGRGARSWWQTLPGALTALAGLITAVTGLVVAVNQLGLFGSEDDSAPPKAVATASVPGTTEPPGSPAAAYGVSFPQGAKATVGVGTYEIVGTRVEQRNPGELALHLTVRLTNTGPYDGNFWSSSFRLLVDGLPRAPINDLNEIVAGNSSAVGTVTFAVPESARNVTLLVGDDQAKAVRLPVELRPR